MLDFEQKFETWRKTVKKMNLAEFEKIVTSFDNSECPNNEFLVYDNSYWITKLQDGRYNLHLGNQEYFTSQTICLEDLEIILFKYTHPKRETK